MDAITRLRDTLAYWGFFEAADRIETNNRDAEAALPLWTHYPKCMDIYTTHITARPVPITSTLRSAKG